MKNLYEWTIHFRFIHREEEYTGAILAFCEGVFFVTSDAADKEAFCIDTTPLAVSVHHGVDGLIIFVEDGNVHDVFPNKYFI